MLKKFLDIVKDILLKYKEILIFKINLLEIFFRNVIPIFFKKLLESNIQVKVCLFIWFHQILNIKFLIYLITFSDSSL